MKYEPESLNGLVQLEVCKMEPKKSDRLSTFDVPWMDSCYEETFFPSCPWHAVHKQFSAALAKLISTQMSSPQRALILSNLIGHEFMQTFFHRVKLDRNALAGLAEEERRRLYLQASSWLKVQTLAAAREVGCESVDGSERSPDMKAFIRHTTAIFLTGLNRHLYKQEQHFLKAGEKRAGEEGETGLESAFGVQRTAVGVGSIPHPTSPYKQRVAPIALPQSGALRPYHDAMHDGDSVHHISPAEGDYASLTSRSSDHIADVLVKVLERNPRLFELTCKRLHGRPLPPRLRCFIWTSVLYQNEKDRLGPGVNVERIIRERFGKGVTRSMSEQRMQRATQSPIHRLIENTVIEMYETTPVLAASRSKGMLREAVRALNVLYTYDGTYEPYLILWLSPLQIALTGPRTHDVDSHNLTSHGQEDAYDLAMFLDLLNMSIFPTWAKVFAMADLVMNLLLKNDKPFYDHLEAVSRIQVAINPRDFVLEHIHKERKEAENMLHKPVSASSDQASEHILSDPRLFLRKWIGEGFVAILGRPAVMYIWDQLFLKAWHSSVIQDFTLVVLLLCRAKFMAAGNYSQVKDVFLYAPASLLVADIQSAWLRLHERRPYAEIAETKLLKKVVLGKFHDSVQSAVPADARATPSVREIQLNEQMGHLANELVDPLHDRTTPTVWSPQELLSSHQPPRAVLSNSNSPQPAPHISTPELTSDSKHKGVDNSQAQPLLPLSDTPADLDNGANVAISQQKDEVNNI